MTTYNTGNPVPSGDAKDRFDNSQTLDEFINGGAEEYVNRVGNVIKSLRWMQTAATGIPAVEAALAAAQSALEAAAARDAAQLTAGVFATTAAGIAGTADGAYFSVPVASGSTSLILYKNTAGVAVEVTRYPSAAAVDNLKQLVDNTIPFVQYPSLDLNWPHVITDKSGFPLLGVKGSGVAWGLFDAMPGLPCLGAYAWCITDIAGVILLGVKWSGEVVAYGLGAGEVVAYVDGPQGAQDAFVLVGGVPYQLTSTGDNFSPVAASGSVRFIRRYGSVSAASVAIPAAGSVATFVVKVLHLLCSGQSLAMGTSATLTTVQPPTANRLLTIQNGVRLVDQDATLTLAQIAPFKPLVANTLESPCVQMTAQLNRIRALPSNAGTVTSLHGRGGYTIAQLSKGTLYYSNSMVAVQGVKNECDAKGYAYEVPFVDWIQGEADRALGVGSYLNFLLQLQSDYDTDITAISGQAKRVKLLVDQISNWTSYNRQESNVPFDQLNAALLYPDRFVCAGPKYWVQTVGDGTHLTAESSMRVGAMHARPAEAIINGASWLPTHITKAERVGTIVTLEFHCPSGDLVIDTGRVSDPGNFGLRWIDDTLSASILSVRLAGNNKVEVTLSGIPDGANPKIGVADIGISGAGGGPMTGPRSCFRDSQDDFDAYGYPIFNWACHQRVNVISE